MKNLFNTTVAKEVIGRIESLTVKSTPKWGTMSASKMLAHCCVTYEMVYTNNYPRPNRLTRWILKKFIKNSVVSEKAYPKNIKTAAQFIIKNEPVFDTEKTRLIAFIKQTQALGATVFEGKDSHSFGNLTANEWNVLFYKHLAHHLTQFGV
tara:strand:- start:1079 stop:1531 length:453 start_codon:yes stop_codon:yes gene_type:complete